MQFAVARGGYFGHERPLPRVELDDFHPAQHLVLDFDAGVLDVHDPLLPGAGLDGYFRRDRNGEHLYSRKRQTHISTIVQASSLLRLIELWQ